MHTLNHQCSIACKPKTRRRATRVYSVPFSTLFSNNIKNIPGGSIENQKCIPTNQHVYCACKPETRRRATHVYSVPFSTLFSNNEKKIPGSSIENQKCTLTNHHIDPHVNLKPGPEPIVYTCRLSTQKNRFSHIPIYFSTATCPMPTLKNLICTE